jgi:hypothetical protein
MYDGEVHFYNDHGTQLDKKLYVPRLRVRKGWYVGLAGGLLRTTTRLTLSLPLPLHASVCAFALTVSHDPFYLDMSSPFTTPKDMPIALLPREHAAMLVALRRKRLT